MGCGSPALSGAAVALGGCTETRHPETHERGSRARPGAAPEHELRVRPFSFSLEVVAPTDSALLSRIAASKRIR